MSPVGLKCWLLIGALALSGCPGTALDDTGGETGKSHTGETDTPPPVLEREVVLSVIIDGQPAGNTLVVQAGTQRKWTTDELGQVKCEVDFTVPGGDIYLVASHPEARIKAVQVPKEGDEALQIQLERYTPDNPDYEFADPGTPTRRDTTSQCAHCHVSISEAWYDSPHRTSATNPIVQDTYAGVAHVYASQEACEAAGGNWWVGLEPGTTTPTNRCYLGMACSRL